MLLNKARCQYRVFMYNCFLHQSPVHLTDILDQECSLTPGLCRCQSHLSSLMPYHLSFPFLLVFSLSFFLTLALIPLSHLSISSFLNIFLTLAFSHSFLTLALPHSSFISLFLSISLSLAPLFLLNLTTEYSRV